jgi:hypothetical protein
MLEKNKNADQENVDYEVIGILGHTSVRNI